MTKKKTVTDTEKKPDQPEKAMSKSGGASDSQAWERGKHVATAPDTSKK